MFIVDSDVRWEMFLLIKLVEYKVVVVVFVMLMYFISFFCKLKVCLNSLIIFLFFCNLGLLVWYSFFVSFKFVV